MKRFAVAATMAVFAACGMSRAFADPAPMPAAALAPEALPDFAAVLPKADVAAGEKSAARCAMCHDLTSAKTTKAGPALWNIVNAPRASVPGYGYSDALKASREPWTYERLYSYLKAPAVMVPGTKMLLGTRSSQDRVNILAYLRTVGDKPAPLPVAAGAPAAPKAISATPAKPAAQPAKKP